MFAAGIRSQYRWSWFYIYFLLNKKVIRKVLLSSVFHCTSDLRIADSVIFLANLLRREDNVKHFNAKIWQSQNDVMGEKVIGRKATCCFSCILAMVTPFVWIIVILHLVSFPTHLLRVRQTTCLTSPGSFSADGPSGPQQEGPRTTGCSPQRCNSCTEIQFYHSQALHRIISIQLTLSLKRLLQSNLRPANSPL